METETIELLWKKHPIILNYFFGYKKAEVKVILQSKYFKGTGKYDKEMLKSGLQQRNKY